MQRSAVFSPCGTYRYHLQRRWSQDGLTLLFVLLNPSTADAERDDPTIRRCVGFGRSLGFGAIEVVNLYAFRATDPRALRAVDDPVGPDNDRWTRRAIARTAAAGGRICLAWGCNAIDLERPRRVLSLVRAAATRPLCLRTTRGGHPQHPLRLPAGCTLEPLGATRDAIDAAGRAAAAAPAAAARPIRSRQRTDRGPREPASAPARSLPPWRA